MPGKITMTKPSKEARVPLRAWLTPGRDDALIEAWQAIPDGAKSQVLKSALTAYFELPGPQQPASMGQIAADMQSLLEELGELKGLVGDLYQRPALPIQPKAQAKP